MGREGNSFAAHIGTSLFYVLALAMMLWPPASKATLLLLFLLALQLINNTEASSCQAPASALPSRAISTLGVRKTITDVRQGHHYHKFQQLQNDAVVHHYEYGTKQPCPPPPTLKDLWNKGMLLWCGDGCREPD